MAIAGPIADPATSTARSRRCWPTTSRYVGHLNHGELPGYPAAGRRLRLLTPLAGAVRPGPGRGHGLRHPGRRPSRGAAAEVVAATGGVLARSPAVVALADAIRQAARWTAQPSGPACSASTTAAWSARTSSCCRAWSTPRPTPVATRSMTRSRPERTAVMPMSSAEGKELDQGADAMRWPGRPGHVLDIGPGVGTYAKLLAGPEVSHLTGVEIFEPYVHTYRLRRLLRRDHHRRRPRGRAAGGRRGDPGRRGRAHDRRGRPGAVAAGRRCRPAGGLPVHPGGALPAGRDRGQPARTPRGRRLEPRQGARRVPGIQTWWLGTEVGVYERRTD